MQLLHQIEYTYDGLGGGGILVQSLHFLWGGQR